MKHLFYCIVSCCFISACVLTVKKSMLIQELNNLQFISKLTTFASDKLGMRNVESGFGNMCTTQMTHQILEQNCANSIVPIRISIYFTCGNGEYGVCQEGTRHLYYDCNFMLIHEDDNIKSKVCGL